MSNSIIESNVMNIKKTLVVSLLAALPLLKASAQQHHELNFLAPITSITLTNLKQFTNTASPNLAGVTTNVVGLTWTNLIGTQVVAAAGDTTSLVNDVPLWSDRNGNQVFQYTADATNIVGVARSGMTINVHILSGGSGANSAVNFTFVPLPDGVHESTLSGDKFIFGVTANTTSEVDVSTNCPMWNWAGYKMLRLKTIVNTDTDASSQVVVDSVTLNGFVP